MWNLRLMLWLCCAVRVVLWRWCRDFAVLPECFAVLRAVRVVCCVVEAVLRECFAHVRVLCREFASQFLPLSDASV